MTSAVFYARQATREKRREDLRRARQALSAGNPAASHRRSTESASLPPSRFSQKGLLASSIDISASLRHSRPTADLSTDRPRPSRRGRNRASEGWKDACMGISGRKSGKEEKGAHFPNRESVNRTLMWMISRADQDRIAFEGRTEKTEREGRRVREGSLSRGRIGSKLLTRRRQAAAATLHDGCEFRTFFVPDVKSHS